MISINKTYEVVMFLLQKNNYGAIEPSKFNAFAELAVYSIFESLFYSDNLDTLKKGNHLTNSQYADLKKIREEQIDVYSIYSTPSNFTFDVPSGLWKFTGNDLYRATDLSLVNNTTKKKVSIEMGLKTQLNYAVNSNINPPNIYFPECYRVGDDFKVYPEVITGHYVELLYIRKPKTPKWTYNIVAGNPMYNAGASDKQDIDLHQSLYERVVVKICSYAGLSLREPEVMQATANEQGLINQTQS
jgi:hypothetical protein